jgi:hypothetical protein
MKIIAIGDVHNHIKAAEAIAQKYEDTHKIIFTGDYFDDFGDNAEVARKTAIWLKSSITKPNRIHLLGNHDLSYHTRCEFVENGRVMKMYICSGYTEAKDGMITEILGTEEWDKLKLHHFENGWHFTHAGMCEDWFEHPVLGMTDETILETIKVLDGNLINREYSAIIGGAGRCRGGMYWKGGITWHDHQREAQPVRDIFQIYGHTPCYISGHTPRFTGIDEFTDAGGINICIDCGLSQVLEIHEDGTYNKIDTGFDNFYQGKTNKNNLWNS